MVHRQALGEVVHVFSHIRMTMQVESIVLQQQGPGPALDLEPRAAADGEAGGGGVGAALQWVPCGEMADKALSSGVKKVRGCCGGVWGGQKPSFPPHMRPPPPLPSPAPPWRCCG